MAQCLVVLLNDPISPLLSKGEATERYYNPGGVFDEVHIVLCNEDKPDLAKLQPMVGAARLVLHNLPTPPRFFWRTAAWRESLMQGWLEGARALAREISPDLIRCYGPHINATAARAMRDVSKSPVFLSLHNRPDTLPEGLSFPDRIRDIALSALAQRELRAADLVFAVYQSQLPYLRKIGVDKVELAYNVLNPGNFKAKEHYSSGSPVRVLSVGRMIPGKNPENLIRAIADVDSVELTLIGDGPLRGQLEELSSSLGLDNKVTFVRAMDNDQLCRVLPDYDIFAAHNDYPGIPKAVMEPLLAGLPVLLNHPKKELVPELSTDICLLVENSREGYAGGLRKLVAGSSLRRDLGESAKAFSQNTWAPATAEARYADIYRTALQIE